jgi:hypothetical protein
MLAFKEKEISTKIFNFVIKKKNIWFHEKQIYGSSAPKMDRIRNISLKITTQGGGH